ncbi:hypothetical protein EGW08_000301, partial [Elysia chlorotica]
MNILSRSCERSFSIPYSAYNTMGLVDQRKTAILIFEALEKLVSFLSDLNRALVAFIRQELEQLNAIIDEERDNNDYVNRVLLQRGNKLTQNLPDLLSDLPVHHQSYTNMTLCNADPDILAGGNPKDFHTDRQNNSRNCRSSRHYSNTQIISPSAPENNSHSNRCQTFRRQRRRSSAQMGINVNTYNYRCTIDCHPLHCTFCFEDGIMNHLNPHGRSKNDLVHAISDELDQDECDSNISSFQDIGRNSICIRCRLPEHECCNVHNNRFGNRLYENIPVSSHRNGAEQSNPLDDETVNEHRVPLHSQGS